MSLKFGKSKSKSTTDMQNTVTGTEKFQEGYDSLGKMLKGGLNEPQQQGLDMLQGANPYAETIQNANAAIGGISQRYTPFQSAPSRQSGFVAGSGSPDQVDAKTAADYMGLYKNPWENDVVKATNDDLTHTYDILQNRNKMAAATGGAFGGGRQGVNEAATADDFLRNVASTTGNLRSAGFTTAVNAGAGDAGRALSADTTNVNNQFAYDTNNTNREQANNQFNVGAGYQGDQQQLQAINSQIDAVAKQAGISAEQAEMFRNNALDLIKTGQISFGQLEELLKLQTTTFGNHQVGTGTGSNTSFGASASLGDLWKPSGG